MTNLHQLPKTVTRVAKRVGRGLASGKGKTAGRGTKGQKSRSGYNLPRRFEGGQTSLIQRLPKARGFQSRFPKPLTLNIARIETKFQDGEMVNFQTLIKKGLIKNDKNPVKIIGAKKLNKILKFSDVILSQALAKSYKSLPKIVVEKPIASKKTTTKKSTSIKLVSAKTSVKKSAAKK